MKNLKRWLIASGILIISNSLSGAIQTGFEKSRLDFKGKIDMTMTFTDSKLTPDMNYIQMRLVDPYKLRDLDIAGRARAKDLAGKIKRFIDAYAPGGTRFSPDRLAKFRQEIENGRRSGNFAVRRMSVDASWTLAMVETGAATMRNMRKTPVRRRISRPAKQDQAPKFPSMPRRRTR